MAKNLVTYCISCEWKTNHNILFTKKVFWEEEGAGGRKIDTEEENLMLQCKGCDQVSFLTRTKSVQQNNKGGEPFIIEMSYPEPEDWFSPEMNMLSRKEQAQLPESLRNLYDELEIVFGYDCKMLAGISLRMMVENICLDQGIPGRNLQIKIENLCEKGIISKNDLPVLDKLRSIGNISAHEAKGIPLNKLKYALDIVNHCLKSIYIIPRLHKKLKF